MNGIFNKNLINLEKHQPSVFNKLSSYIEGNYKPVNDKIERIILANQNDMVINILIHANQEEYLLFDHEDPIMQSYNWVDKYIAPSNRAEIVFGMGFGFHIEVLLSSFKNKKVFIIEPSIELFYQVMKVRNLESIIKNTILFVDEEISLIMNGVHNLYWDTKEGGIQCQPFEVYSEIFKDLWDELMDKIIKQAQNFNVDINTIRISGEIWIHNYISNLSRINEASNADGLMGNFKGMPGVLVSAGPSLEKNMHLLKKIKDKCVIIAAGTAMKILQENGVTPHFMVGIDAWEGEAEIHKKVKSNEIHFIYSNQVATGSLEHYKGPKFLMNYSVDTYTAGFFRFAGIKSECYLSGPSVANTSFDLLFKMGCNPIILTGQDLAYTGGSNYAGEESGTVIGTGTDPKAKGYILTKDIYGNDIYTNMAFIAIKNFFEGYFERVKDKVEIINATEGGLNIEFARNDTLENVIRNFNFKSFEIDGFIKGIHWNSRFPKNIHEKLKEYTDFIITEIERLEETSKKQLKLVDLIQRDFYHPSKDKKSFDKMVRRVSEFTDIIMESPIYYTILKNLLGNDFFLLKVEVERATSELRNYDDVKDIYTQAIIRQNEILNEKLRKIREYLLTDKNQGYVG